MLKPLNYLNQRGVAIYMALFFVVLVTTISLSWQLQTRIAVKRTLQMLKSDQAYLYAQGQLNFEISLLQATLQKKSGDETSWPIVIEKRFISKKVSLYGQIDDFQARLNLNNMAQAGTKAAFEALVSLLDSSISAESKEALAAAVVAWITPAPLLTPPMININAVYSSFNPPYHAANRPMHSLSELRLVEGISAPLFLALAPYISALPPQTPLSLQHASKEILSAFNIKSEIPTSMVVSEYFLLRADVEAQDLHVVLYTLVYIPATAPTAAVEILWQNSGTV